MPCGPKVRMFLDETIIDVKGGAGGDGIKSFHREKYVAKGGPDGGDGGRGGQVILRASHDLHTLYELEKKHLLKAGNGQRGGTKDAKGRSGEDVILKVPVGTLIRDPLSKKLLGDLTEEGQDFLAAKGGRGGFGNSHFKSPVNRAPRQCTPGEPGEHRKLLLELRLMADCGLVGFPNAGKSSLINRLSNATPKVGSYPFTTLRPHLGWVKSPAGGFILADIPGLIEGAAQGKGLGNRFLRHVERTACLVFVMGLDKPNPMEEYTILLKELESFHPELLQRPRLIALNKIDLLTDPPSLEEWKDTGVAVLPVSAATGAGLPELIKAIQKMVGRKTRVQSGTW